MRSPAAAIAWEFRQRYRWGLMALTGYLLVLGPIKLLILGLGQRVNFDDVSFALVVIVPVTATFIYLLAGFTFGLSGEPAPRPSLSPPPLFSRPVTTPPLARS